MKNTTISIFFSLLALTFCTSALYADGPAQWYKGSLHGHTAWSDGQQLPELVADWYKQNGYNFCVLSDHDKMLEGDFYRANDGVYFPTNSPAEAEAKFGPGWVQYGNGGSTVKLKTLSEISGRLNESGKFLMVQGEEIAATALDGMTVHINGINLGQKVVSVRRADAAETLNANLALVAQQAATLNRPMLAQINHANWRGFYVSPEDAAQATGTRFLEVANCASATIKHYGDATHPGMEKFWDIANTIRMENLGELPMFGTATDDAHHYAEFGPTKYNPGRGAVVVRATELSGDALVEAMDRGDFYATTGVSLSTLYFSATTGVLSVAVEAKGLETYTIDFIGTPKGTDPTKNLDGTYSSEIGKILLSVSGSSASYTLDDNDLYVRAHIRSSRLMDNPANSNVQYEEAWTQPVGEWLVVPEPNASVMLCGLAAMSLFYRLYSRRPSAYVALADKKR